MSSTLCNLKNIFKDNNYFKMYDNKSNFGISMKRIIIVYCDFRIGVISSLYKVICAVL